MASNTDTTYTIDGIEAEALAQNQTPTLTRGAEPELEFRFKEITEEESVAAPAYGVQYSFSYGGSTETTTRTFGDTYEALLDYFEYRGAEIVRYGTTDRAQPWFRERLPSGAPVDSLVVPIETGDDVPNRDMWAIILGGEDLSNPVSPFRRVQLQLFILAPLDEYADRTAVYNDIGDQL